MYMHSAVPPTLAGEHQFDPKGNKIGMHSSMSYTGAALHLHCGKFEMILFRMIACGRGVASMVASESRAHRGLQPNKSVVRPALAAS